jgi:hypothetical protein
MAGGTGTVSAATVDANAGTGASDTTGATARMEAVMGATPASPATICWADTGAANARTAATAMDQRQLRDMGYSWWGKGLALWPIMDVLNPQP